MAVSKTIVRPWQGRGIGEPTESQGPFTIGARAIRDWTWVVGPLLAGAAYYLGARLGFALTLQPTPVSTLWPPNAILFAALLLSPAARWPWILLAAFAAHLAVQVQANVPVGMMLCWYISNCFEALLGATLVRRLIGGRSAFDTFHDVLAFVACALAATFFSTFVDIAFVRLNDFGDATLWHMWRTRFFSNTLANVTLVPVIVIVGMSAHRLRRASTRRWVEAAVWLTILAGVSWVVFDVPTAGAGQSPGMLFAVMPLLLVGALRYGPLGASTGLMACALLAIAGAVGGKGPFVASTPLDNALSIQLFLIGMQISMLSLTAVLEERTRGEEEVRRREQQFGLALQTARLAKWDWLVRENRAVLSEASWHMIGREQPASNVLERFAECVHPDDRRMVMRAVADAVAGGPPLDIEFRVIMPDGSERWILSRGTITTDQHGVTERMVGVNVDITDRRRAQAEREEQQRQMAHLGRISLVGELSVVLTHELRQPLTAILLNASAGQQLVEGSTAASTQAPLREILDEITQDSRRASEVISRLGALLRNEKGTLQLFDLNDLASDALLIARPDLASRRVAVSTRFAPGLPRVAADGVQLQQVLLNLVVNACDAMESVPAPTRRVLVTTGLEDGQTVRATVSDTGPGIRPALLHQIFDPFVTSKPQGLGIGLSICRSIVDAHGGRIWAENGPDGGAVLSFTIPLERPAPSLARSAG